MIYKIIKRRNEITFLPAIVLSFFLFTIAACTFQNSSKTKTEPDVKISSVDLCLQFKQDRLTAEKNYKEKTLQVTGTVDRTGTNVKGDLYVSLVGLPSLGNVQCYMSGPFIDQAKKLKLGQNITLKGWQSDYIINVILNDCEMVQ